MGRFGKFIAWPGKERRKRISWSNPFKHPFSWLGIQGSSCLAIAQEMLLSICPKKIVLCIILALSASFFSLLALSASLQYVDSHTMGQGFYKTLWGVLWLLAFTCAQAQLVPAANLCGGYMVLILQAYQTQEYGVMVAATKIPKESLEKSGRRMSQGWNPPVKL